MRQRHRKAAHLRKGNPNKTTKTATATEIKAERTMSFDYDEADPSPADDESAGNPVDRNGSDRGRCSPSGTSRAGRWIEVLLCFLPVPAGIALEFGTPHQRPMPVEQTTTEDGDSITIESYLFGFPRRDETVSPPLMFALAIAVPFLLQVGLIAVLQKRGASTLRRDALHKTLCVYFMATGWTQTLTNLAKLYVGYLRPVFFEYCQPDGDYGECTDESGAHKGRVSFPSGHASMSVCGLLLFSLFLEDTLGLSAWERGLGGGRRSGQSPEASPWTRLGSVACFSPMLLAIFIAVSRVHDNFHHPADVVGGALLGGSIASLMFGIWFR